ncbi:MAG TPA: LamG domain-containing protein [Polyangiaceae bacterium]|nr:LamG domain-containing protein [Polyangiaceae bacterium]
MGKTHAVLGSPALWIVLLMAGAFAAACGASDSHKQTRAEEAGAAGSTGAAGGIGSPGSSSGGAAGEHGGGEPAGGNASSPSGGASGDTGTVNTSVAGGAGNAGGGGAPSEGCLALHFGTDTDTVQVPDDTIPDFGAAATMELWVLPDANDAGMIPAEGVLLNKWTNFLEDKYVALTSQGSIYVFFHGNSGELANFQSTPAAKPGVWTHIAVVYDATSVRLYTDGVKVGEQNGAIQPDSSNGPVQIGASSRGTVRAGLHGFYSDVRLSNVARYTSNFTPAAHLATDTDTIGLWKLDEGSGTDAADSSALDNPGTITGAAWQLAPCR